MNTLNHIRPGKSVFIEHVGGEGALKRRLMEMGLTRGTRVTVRKVAPLGDPIEVNVRSYSLSLRKADAALVRVSAEGR
ncbi:MAG: ferrous iron transport protein A [Oscillospiraceae bacterium]|jgi:ferrous iron transport protein A|nr:ferrous iron transport protein A [Oscillospiraceae bacterium]